MRLLVINAAFPIDSYFCAASSSCHDNILREGLQDAGSDRSSATRGSGSFSFFAYTELFHPIEMFNDGNRERIMKERRKFVVLFIHLIINTSLGLFNI